MTTSSKFNVKFPVFLLIAALVGCESEKDPTTETNTTPTTGFNFSTLVVTEESGTKNIKLPVALTNSYREKWVSDNEDQDPNTDYDLSLLYETTYNTATDSDIVFHSAQFSKNLYDPYFIISFTVYSDNELEENETVIISLEASDDIGITAGMSSQVEITIEENGEAQRATIEQQNQVVSPGSSVPLTINLNNSTTASLSLPVVFGGNAIFGTDYTVDNSNVTENSVTIPTSVDSYTFNLNILNNSTIYSGKQIEFSLSDEADILVDTTISNVYVLGNQTLNDTGVVANSDASNAQAFSTEVPGYPRQDAQFGLSATSPGTDGWQLRKINSQGNTIDSSVSDTEEWRCTIDDTTSLVWATQGVSDKNSNTIEDSLEVEITVTDSEAESGLSQITPDYHVKPDDVTESSNMLLSNYRYSYFSEDSESNGGVTGLERPTLYKYSEIVPEEEDTHATKETVLNAQASEYCANPNNEDDYSCTSESLIDYANSVGICGYTGWRLPSVEEVVSVIDFKTGNGSFSRVFPNFTQGTILTKSTTPQATSAVFCATSDGEIQQCAKNTPSYIRLVKKVGE